MRFLITVSEFHEVFNLQVLSKDALFQAIKELFSHWPSAWYTVNWARSQHFPLESSVWAEGWCVHFKWKFFDSLAHWSQRHVSIPWASFGDFGGICQNHAIELSKLVWNAWNLFCRGYRNTAVEYTTNCSATSRFTEDSLRWISG